MVGRLRRASRSRAHPQAHVFAHWAQCSPFERTALLAQLREFDPARVNQARERVGPSRGWRTPALSTPAAQLFAALRASEAAGAAGRGPGGVVPAVPDASLDDAPQPDRARWWAAGLDAAARGHVAVVLLAGAAAARALARGARAAPLRSPRPPAGQAARARAWAPPAPRAATTSACRPIGRCLRCTRAASGRCTGWPWAPLPPPASRRPRPRACS